MKKSLAIVVVLAMAVSANASVNTTFEEVLPTPGTVPTGYRVWNMMTDVDSDWTNARLDLILTSGTLYQDVNGDDLRPNPTWFGLAPTLEWDTFLTVPGGYPNIVGVADDPPYMGDTSITASWFDSVVGTAGVYKIAQITLSTDAAGTVSGKVYDVDTQGDGVLLAPGWYVDGGAFVPEPATLVLLAIGGIGALLRKRR